MYPNCLTCSKDHAKSILEIRLLLLSAIEKKSHRENNIEKLKNFFLNVKKAIELYI